MSNIPFETIPSPCYVLDEKLLRRNLKILKSVKDRANVEIILAFKGFAMWGVFPVVREYIQGATASSLYEARLAYEEMKTRPHTYAPVYKEEEFDAIAGMSSHLTFNSLSQFEKFKPKLKGNDFSVGLRVNPEYSEVSTDLYNPCAPGSRLGVLIENMPDVLPDEIEGLHFHALCESPVDDLEKTLQAFENKFSGYLKKVKWVNMGGGHLITHKDYDVEKLIALLKDFKERHEVEVILEPGAAFAWETGFLVSTVQDVVENKGIKTAMLDVSFTAHMPDCLEMPYKPKILGACHEPVVGKPTYRMGGNSCLSGDYVGDWSFDKPLQPGDTIVFNDMMHYTMVKTTMFNGINHPSIGMWTVNGELKLFRKFTYEDYRNRLS